MNCYKCGSSELLSIKARHRDGRIRLMICRNCRNKDSRKYIQRRKATEDKKVNINPVWHDLSIKSQEAILSKYS